MAKEVRMSAFGGPDVLEIVEAMVEEPGAGQVRIVMEAIGVNRLDALIRAGQSPRPVPLPARLGLEGTGVIDAVGAGVVGFAVGDPVLVTAVPDAHVNGTYATSLVVSADRVIRRPAGIDPVTAAALWVGHSTAYGALFEKAALRPGDHLLITGATSSVGLAAIQVANQIGAVPIAVTRSAARRAALLAAGAAEVIALDEEELVARALELTGGAGAAVALDTVMGPGLADLARAVRFAGRIVCVGWLDPRPPAFPAVPVTVHRYMSFEHVLDPAVVTQMSAFLTAGLRSGVVAPIVDRVFRFDAVADAHRHLEGGDGIGKVVLSV